MTSKEALKILFMTCDEELLQDNYNILFASQLEEIIRKDLDKLEKSSWKYDVLPPTLEEVKKEWEKLGYKWFENNGIIVLKQQIQFTNKFVIITLNSDKKAYWKNVDDNFNFIPFMFQEHQLLTKTMKALRWL